MRCPFCDEVADKVLETRASTENRIRRSRICRNGHKFPTYEVLPGEAVLTNRRHRQIVKRVVRDCEPVAEVAADFDMGIDQARRVIRERAPEYQLASASQRRRWKHERHSSAKTVQQLTADGRLVAVYESSAAAARETGFKQPGISAAACGRWPSYKGYQWRYIT